MSTARTMVLLLPLLLLSACGGSEEDDRLAVGPARTCVKQHPASEVESARALAAAELACLDAQENCSDDRCADRCRWDALISERAARCIASSAGFEDGIEDVNTNIGYDQEQRRPTWSLENVLVRNGPGGESSGATIWIDAETGEVLAMGGWEQTP